MVRTWRMWPKQSEGEEGPGTNSLKAKKEDDQEPLDPDKGNVPDRERAVAWIQSFLESVHGKVGKKCLARLALVKRVSWNPAEMRES